MTKLSMNSQLFRNGLSKVYFFTEKQQSDANSQTPSIQTFFLISTEYAFSMNSRLNANMNSYMSAQSHTMKSKQSKSITPYVFTQYIITAHAQLCALFGKLKIADDINDTSQVETAIFNACPSQASFHKKKDIPLAMNICEKHRFSNYKWTKMKPNID